MLLVTTVFAFNMTGSISDGEQSDFAFHPSDTNRIYSLLELGYYALDSSDYDQAIVYVTEAIALSNDIHLQEGLYHGHNYLGLIHYYQGRYEQASSEFEFALAAGLTINKKQYVADVYNNSGLVYAARGNFDQARMYFNKAIATRDETDLRGISAGYSCLGNTFYQQGDIRKSIEYYLLALEIDEKLGIPTDIFFTKTSIGAFYYALQQYEKAFSYYHAAYELSLQTGRKELISSALANMAQVYQHTGKLHDALEYYRQAIQLNEETGELAAISKNAMDLAGLQINMGLYDEAQLNLDKCIQINKKIENTPGLGESYFNLGKLYTKTGDYKEADSIFKTAITLFQSLQLPEKLSNVYVELAKLDSLRSDYSSAYSHFKLFTRIKDSLDNINNQEALLDIQHKYEAAKKDKEIQQLESEKQLDQLQLKIKSTMLARAQVQNQVHMQQIALLDKDKALQASEIEKHEARRQAEQVVSTQKETQLKVLSQDNELKSLRLRKQQQVTWYSIGGFLLFSLIAVLYYLHYQTKQRLKLQMLRNKIASDLHDDVGSTLSSIAIFSEMAQQQSKEVIPLLHTIGESSRRMLDAMGDIVWTINPENDDFERIIMRMRNFAYELLGSKKIEFAFEAGEDIASIKLPMEIRKNLYLIFKEATNNMVKYAEADTAMFSLKSDRDTLTMRIRDNGKGFDANRVSIGNGIKNMKKRASEIGAILLIDSAPGNGTTIELKITV